MDLKESKLTLMARDTWNCLGGECPAIYRDENGRIFIQGYRLSEEDRRSLSIAQNEEIIELAPSLLQFLKTIPQE